MKHTYTKKDGMYVYVDEVMQDLQISKPLAYRLIREWIETLEKICEVLQCGIGDITEIIPEGKNDE